jgi:hypothetical protein
MSIKFKVFSEAILQRAGWLDAVERQVVLVLTAVRGRPEAGHLEPGRGSQSL